MLNKFTICFCFVCFLNFFCYGSKGNWRGLGKLNITSVSPTKNDSKPLYDPYAASWRYAGELSHHEQQITRRGDSPLGSPLLQGDPNSNLGHASAEAGFTAGFTADLGDRCDVGDDVRTRLKGESSNSVMPSVLCEQCTTLNSLLFLKPPLLPSYCTVLPLGGVSQMHQTAIG